MCLCANASLAVYEKRDHKRHQQLTQIVEGPVHYHVTKSLGGEVELEGEADDDPPGAPAPTLDGPEKGGVRCEEAPSVQIGQGRALFVHHGHSSVR